MMARSLGLGAAALLIALSASACQSTPPTQEDRAREAVRLYRQGVTLFSDGQVDQGITLLERAKEQQPAYTLLRYDLGRMLLLRGQRSDARALEAREEARLHRQRGEDSAARRKEVEAQALVESARDDFRAAQSNLRFALDRMPDEPNVPYFLAQVHTGLEDYATAREYLRQAMRRAEAVGAQPDSFQREKLQSTLELLEEAAKQQKSSR